MKNFDELINLVLSEYQKQSIEEQIEFSNKMKTMLHENGPFKNEPVDLILWVKNETVKANNYNPNVVAPVEMDLLHTSIKEDGYTQPIVTYVDSASNGVDREVVDGFHRNRIGKEKIDIKERVLGYLPVVTINESVSGIDSRMASTIRHNRARGKHGVDSMSNIVMELKKRNWTDDKIAKNLGMDSDEVLRLCQITGLAEMFSEEEYSDAWDIDDSDDVIDLD